MNKNKLLGLVSLIGTAFIGGAILPSIIRLGTGLVHPFVLNWLRVFLALLIVLVLFRGKYRLKLILQRKNLLSGMALGLGLGLNITMFAFGIQHTTLIASQLIYVFTPIATGFLAYFLLKERISLKKFLGMLLALSGVLILLIFSNSAEQTNSLGTFYGNFLIFIGMLGYAAYVVFSKKMTIVFNVIEMIIFTNISLSILLSPLAIYGLFQQGLTVMNPQTLTIMLVIALSALIFTFLGQTSIKYLSAGTASLSSLLSPEFAAIAGIVVYHEKLSFLLLLSMVLSIGGTMLSTMAEKTTIIDKIKLAINKLKLNKGFS